MSRTLVPPREPEPSAHGPIVCPMRVHVVDPSAYTPPYDHALCSALAAAGAEVELFTSRFAYGAVPSSQGYVKHDFFYRSARPIPGDSRAAQHARRALKLAQLSEADSRDLVLVQQLRDRRVRQAHGVMRAEVRVPGVVGAQFLAIQHRVGENLAHARSWQSPRRKAGACC